MEDSPVDTLYLICTGTPTPTPERFGTCMVLQLRDEFLMFDCGPAATHKLVKAGLFPTQINHLFFTHHHFDHNADYPCFLLCRWDQSTGKEKPLKIFGPPPTQRITEQLVGPDGAFSLDWKARVGALVSQSVHVNRGGPLPRPKPAYSATDISAGEVMEEAGFKIAAAHASHVEPWLESLAYRVDTDRGSITFAGDTGPCESVARIAHASDVLVANCWDHQETMEKSGEAPGQTGTLDAAKMAQDTGVKKLVLIHTGPRLCEPDSKERAIADIARIYEGEIIFGEELMRLDLW